MMTKEEQQKVAQAMSSLDTFVKSDKADRQHFAWYVQWQGVYQQAQAQIAALVVKEAQAEPKPEES